jgi:hypothetical protein
MGVMAIGYLSYYFMFYLTTLSVVQPIWQSIAGCLVNELAMTVKKTAMA